MIDTVCNHCHRTETRFDIVKKFVRRLDRNEPETIVWVVQCRVCGRQSMWSRDKLEQWIIDTGWKDMLVKGRLIF